MGENEGTMLSNVEFSARTGLPIDLTPEMEQFALFSLELQEAMSDGQYLCPHLRIENGPQRRKQRLDGYPLWRLTLKRRESKPHTQRDTTGFHIVNNSQGGVEEFTPILLAIGNAKRQELSDSQKQDRAAKLASYIAAGHPFGENFDVSEVTPINEISGYNE